MDDEFSVRFFRRRRSLKLFLQRENAECGLCCVAMIAHYHGRPVDLLSARSQIGASPHGTTLKSMIDIGAYFRLASRAIQLDINELKEIRLPCVLHWAMGHYVCLTKIKKNGWEICDPASGRRTVDAKEFAEKFTGIALELYPDAGFVPSKGQEAKKTRLDWSKLTAHAPKASWMLSQAVVMAFLVEILSLISPVITQVTFDRLSGGLSSGLLVQVAAVAALLTLMVSGLGLVKGWVLSALKNQVFYHWNKNIFSHLIRLPQAYFEKRRLGDIVSRFGAINVIQQTITANLLSSIIDGFAAMACLCMLACYSMKFFFLSTVGMLLYFLFRFFTYRSYLASSAEQIKLYSIQQGRLIEAVRSSQTVKLLNAQSIIESNFNKVVADSTHVNMDLSRWSLMSEAVERTIYGFQSVIILVIGTLMVQDHVLSAGSLVAAMTYTFHFSSKTIACINFYIQLRLLRIQGGRISDIIHSEQESGVYTKYQGHDGRMSLLFNGVGYRYSSSDPWLFTSLDLSIEHGTNVAIIGRTGAGKSTIAKLMLGLVEPTAGTIRVGNVDSKHVGKFYLRENVAGVLQETDLLSGTIAQNICMFDESMRHEDIVSVAKLACIHDEIAALPRATTSTTCKPVSDPCPSTAPSTGSAPAATAAPHFGHAW